MTDWEEYIEVQEMELVQSDHLIKAHELLEESEGELQEAMLINESLKVRLDQTPKPSEELDENLLLW